MEKDKTATLLELKRAILFNQGENTMMTILKLDIIVILNLTHTVLSHLSSYYEGVLAKTTTEFCHYGEHMLIITLYFLS